MSLATQREAFTFEEERVREGGRRADPSRKNSRERFKAAVHARGIRQAVLGALFLVLLGGGFFFPVIGYFIPLCMVAGIGMASFRGRKWCDWYCPRGSFADAYMKWISPGRRIPAALRSWWLRVGVLAFLMTVLTFQIVRLWPDFVLIGGFFMTLLAVTTAIGVVMAIAVHQRAWCYVCPIGSISHWVGRNRRPLVLDRENCVDCKVCAGACPMKLEPFATGEKGMSGRGDCLKCGLCAAVCPRDALALEDGR